MIYPIGERARGAYSGAQSLLHLRSTEKDSGSGDQSAVETLHEFSYMFPPNMGVIVFCTSPGSMYPGNLAGAMAERGRLSARSTDSSLPPNPAEKTRIRTSSGAEGGYLGAVWREVSGSCSRPMRSLGTPALEGIVDQGTATKIGGAKTHWPNIRWRVPALGPDCETGRRRAHLRSGRRTGWRVFEQARTMVPHHLRCEGRPERCSRADDNKPSRGFPWRSGRARCVWVFW